MLHWLTLMLMESVSIMVRRSMPIPNPPVGGSPYSRAVQNVSSIWNPTATGHQHGAHFQCHCSYQIPLSCSSHLHGLDISSISSMDTVTTSDVSILHWCTGNGSSAPPPQMLPLSLDLSREIQRHSCYVFGSLCCQSGEL